MLKVVDEPGVISGVDYSVFTTITVIGDTIVELVFPDDFFLAP